ncbi:diguanylate cyclase [Legionella bononiensis]|uniref:diguanylate cyclase n=1 Tax=Legionella bononiensis TaxID=2793102 RepID=A0ABS1W6P2_9GAMM|nr:diguanylate cyclase [Legionella bononiensis]MBL7478439.1 diguanylate cyclase [Legionella bononiensis]MBL7525036.1 diguanylate cyclase [Legionella bononiensis]MBL7561332.1 diguanylate cyclase [Legionella bononiensis]
MNINAQNKLNELIAIYSKNLPEKIHRIEMLWKEQQHHWNVDHFQDFHREVHSLCGSSGTYGYMELSKAARQMEVFLKNILTQGQLTQEDKKHIASYINQLKKVLSLELPKKLPVVESRPEPQVEKMVVYILEQDKNLNRQLYESLKQIDYEPFQIQDLITLRRAVEEQVPVAIILDTYYLKNNGIEYILELQKEQPIPIQLLCILPNEDIKPRLEAIRAGCTAFFQKPIDVIQLTQILNYKCSTIADESYRILIIDDSESLAEYYSLILNQAGMNARAITNPLNLLKELESFKPNLLLMDVYMPECTGFELAAVLRQESRYTKIPIIFLSTEDDKDKKLFAISLGGDDFLTKPISPQHLISAVRSRSKRASILNYYMTTDSLSGLLNHSSILNQLDIQLAKARQEHLPLSFIMVDIDHFKKINDSFGHPVGDMVIKKLSSMFLSRIRSQDNVGRYGGEEFALIFPGTTPHHSKTIADNLREQFSQCRFIIENEHFSVTFSAGISFFDGFKSGSTIIEQADQALYQAKQLGRNLVVIFDK